MMQILCTRCLNSTAPEELDRHHNLLLNVETLNKSMSELLAYPRVFVVSFRLHRSRQKMRDIFWNNNAIERKYCYSPLNPDKPEPTQTMLFQALAITAPSWNFPSSK